MGSGQREYRVRRNSSKRGKKLRCRTGRCVGRPGARPISGRRDYLTAHCSLPTGHCVLDYPDASLHTAHCMSLTIAVSTQRQILAFWLPLAASWALMSAEGPILQAVIARLPELQTQLAAFGIVMSLEIAIESPVIMLLATSTALSTNAGNYLTVRRFMIWVNLLATVAAAIVAFTPVYILLVPGIMGIPEHIAAAARPGMKIMTFWSAAIGWRRYVLGFP